MIMIFKSKTLQVKLVAQAHLQILMLRFRGPLCWILSLLSLMQTMLYIVQEIVCMEEGSTLTNPFQLNSFSTSTDDLHAMILLCNTRQCKGSTIL